jgi:hypothetical protein
MAAELPVDPFRVRSSGGNLFIMHVSDTLAAHCSRQRNRNSAIVLVGQVSDLENARERQIMYVAGPRGQKPWTPC